MEETASLIGFALAASVTPGPNTLMIAAGAASHGPRAVLPHMLGITFGFGAMLVLVGLGLAGPLAASPALHAVLRWVGAAWLLWLAWKIATAPPPEPGQGRPPLGFLGGALFQWVNPKAWMVGAAAMTTFAVPGEPLLPQVLWIAFVFTALSMPCLAVWVGVGAGARRVLGSPGRLRAFNIAMALLLVLSLVPLLRG